MVGSCAGLLYFGFKSADGTVSPLIDALFAAIDNGTFPETYETETTKEFRDVTTKQQYADIGKSIATRLGRLKSKSVKGFNMRQFNADSFVDATYDATFEKGQGTITVKMKRESGVWKLVLFGVNSPVFEANRAIAKCASCGAPHTATALFCPSCGKAIPTSQEKSGSPPTPTSN